ncbi:MAG: hypothetical protein ACOX1Y_04965 [Zhaonellaceae bacterium]|jgi:hypothetical protein|nr:hypothetical protein [Clostridia bacterium]
MPEARTFLMLCLYVLIIAVLEEILRSKGKEKWAKALHFAVLSLGLILIGKVFLQLTYLAEEILFR